jgi:hypothetical protein
LGRGGGGGGGVSLTAIQLRKELFYIAFTFWLFGHDW